MFGYVSVKEVHEEKIETGTMFEVHLYVNKIGPTADSWQRAALRIGVHLKVLTIEAPLSNSTREWPAVWNTRPQDPIPTHVDSMTTSLQAEMKMRSVYLLGSNKRS